MKLISLRLENFRQHRDTLLEFRDGMTAIVGANGTGKSTIVEAIRYALFGAARGSVREVRFLWAGRNRARVTLVFELAGRRWEAMRSEDDASLVQVEDDKKQTVATGIKATQEKIERLLRLNDEQFTNSFCALQKGLAFLTFSTNRKRQEEVGRMLGYERLRVAAGAAVERRKQRDAELVGLQEGLGNLETLKQDVVEAKKDLGSQQSAFKGAQATVAKRSKELESAAEPARRAEAWIKLEAQKQELAAQGRVRDSEVKRETEAVAQREAEAAEAARIKPDADRFETTDALVQRLKLDAQRHAAFQRALAEVGEAETKLAQAKAALEGMPKGDVAGTAKAVGEATSRLAATRNQRERAIADWERAKADTRASAARAEAESKGASKRLAEAEDLVRQGKCPQCGQAIGTDFQTAMEALRDDARRTSESARAAKAASEAAQQEPEAVKAAALELKAAEEHYTHCQNLNEEAQKRNASVVEASTRVASLQDVLDKARANAAESKVEYDAGQLAKAEAELVILKPIRDRYVQVKDSAARLAEAKAKLDAAQKAFAALKEQAAELDRQMAALGIATREAADTLRNGQTTAQAALQIAQAEARLAEQNVKTGEERVERIRRQIAEVEARQAKIAEVQTESKLYKHVGQELDALRALLNERIRPDLELRASNLINDLTNARYSTIRLDEDFNATVVEDDSTAKSVISGGEEDIVALALRLALSELIQERHGMPMSLLILDEVYGSLDSERRQSVMDQLSALKGRFEQILVISHIEDTTQVADWCFYLSRDADTRATVVSDAPATMPSGLELAVE